MKSTPVTFMPATLTDEERLAHVGRLAEDPEAASKRAQPSSAAWSSWTGGSSAGATALSCARISGSSAPDARTSVPTVSRRVAQRRLRALGDRAEHVVDEPLARLERLPLHDEHELGIARRAVVVDAELTRLDPALAQRHALGVPERDHGVDLPAIRLGTAEKPMVTFLTRS